ncbi:hypothetical protein GCM10027168_34670 [Streptomyces capparidis]
MNDAPHAGSRRSAQPARPSVPAQRAGEAPARPAPAPPARPARPPEQPKFSCLPGLLLAYFILAVIAVGCVTQQVPD